MLVKNVGNLIIEKMFRIQLSLKKVFGDLRCVTCIYFLYYIELF